MRVCVSGSREFKALHKIQEVLSKLPKDTVIVHGGARGVDWEADTVARKLGLAVEVHPADWDKHGKSAGHIRNREMVQTCDKVIAFWDGQSKGTAGAIRCSSDLGKPCEIIREEAFGERMP